MMTARNTPGIDQTCYTEFIAVLYALSCEITILNHSSKNLRSCPSKVIDGITVIVVDDVVVCNIPRFAAGSMLSRHAKIFVMEQ